MQFELTKVRLPSHGARTVLYKSHFTGLAATPLEAVSRVPRGPRPTRGRSLR